MSDVFWGIIITIGFFLAIALYVFFGAGGFEVFNGKLDVIPFPDAKLTKRQRRSALKLRAKEHRWQKYFGVSYSIGDKIRKTSGSYLGSSISADKLFKSSGGGSRVAAKRSKH